MWGGLLVLAAGLLALPSCERGDTTGTENSAGPTGAVPPPAAAPAEASPTLPKEVTFNEHIQPILSEYCYHCHGPDEATRYPEDNPLRLDLAEHAFEPRENGQPVILKGDPENSLLVRLIRSKDKSEVMPPPKSHKELKPRQIALLERWVDEGAEYQEHWSFLPVTRPELPEKDNPWALNPVDHFIAAKHSEHKLAPNPHEEAARFYRRLHFDLTGLPPNPEDVAAFSWDTLADEVDRLLATTASAEHFARHWLDAARYADTHGIHIDNYRAIWPYRDWVIRAFARNMRWDQFTIEQVAGDMLADPSLDQIVATGFHRCLPTTGEGGAIAEEYDAIYAQDRTNTTSAVWLGLTMGCAACHDHKFDPLTMKDNYSFNAFFRNTTMAAMDRNKEDHPPNIFVPLPADRGRLADLGKEKSALNGQLKNRRQEARADFDHWLANVNLDTDLEFDPTLALHLPLEESEGPIRGTVDGEERQWDTKAPRIDAPNGKALVVSHTPIVLGDLASFSHQEQVSYGGFLRIEGTPSGAVVARMNPSNNFRGWDLWLEGGRPGAHVIDTWRNSASKILAPAALKSGTWHHVMVTYDGSKGGKNALTLYIDGVKSKATPNPNNVGKTIETPVPLRLGARHDNASKLGNGKVALQGLRFYRRLLSPEDIKNLAESKPVQEILALPAEERTDQDRKALFDYYLAKVDGPSLKLREQLKVLSTEEEAIRGRGSVSLIMREKKNSEPFAHMLNRGVYSDKGEKVFPGTPSSLPPLPEDAPRNRLGLAQWLVSRDNPLTARVTMNRLWYQLFGTGLVETTEDFGIMGARPSHPRLLDWLADEFMASGWDHRHMVKLIVTSATYRQSGHVTPAKLEADPDNRLLARGPRYRLDAEQIRDLALAASGLLSDKTGGPPVKPYQPEGVWEAVAMKNSNTRFYKQDSGENLFRRSVYTFWKRTAPHPTMEILNAPAREVFCVRRDRTNTPLQAFVVLNAPEFVEAARQLAESAMKHSGESAARVDFLTTRLFSRTLAEEERPLVTRTLDQALEIYTKDREAALSLISTGATSPDPNLDPGELAAWTLVASQLLNLDETLTK